MRKPLPSEIDVVSRLAAGNTEAIGRVRGWIERVVRYGRWRLPDEENLCQDILLDVQELVRSGGFKGHSQFKTFVYSIAKNKCIDAYRRRRAHDDAIRRYSEISRSDPPNPDPSSAFVAREMVWWVLSRLSESCRQVLYLAFFEHLGSKDVGQRLGISEGNVRVRLHRCLKQARHIIDESHGTE